MQSKINQRGSQRVCLYCDGGWFGLVMNWGTCCNELMDEPGCPDVDVKGLAPDCLREVDAIGVSSVMVWSVFSFYTGMVDLLNVQCNLTTLRYSDLIEETIFQHNARQQTARLTSFSTESQNVYPLMALQIVVFKSDQAFLERNGSL